MSDQKSGGAASMVAVVVLCGAAIVAFGVVLLEMTRSLTGG
jgi:hypothetical protein